MRGGIEGRGVLGRRGGLGSVLSDTSSLPESGRMHGLAPRITGDFQEGHCDVPKLGPRPRYQEGHIRSSTVI